MNRARRMMADAARIVGLLYAKAHGRRARRPGGAVNPGISPALTDLERIRHRIKILMLVR